MNTINYKGWYIHETFLSLCQLSSQVSNGVRIQSPSGDVFDVSSVLAGKQLITRKIHNQTWRSK